MNRLKKIFENALTIDINTGDKFVIFSDLHIGSGGRFDDFRDNSKLFENAIRDYYLKKDYNLILNGDVEELYKFNIKNIESAYSPIYDIFKLYNSKNSLFKIFGNHDFELALKKHSKYNFKLYEAIKLKFKNDYVFIYHGHQTASYLEQYGKIPLYLIRYLLRAISNNSLPLECVKKFQTEKIAYDFSSANHIVSILGHTHRPLFESESKIESLKKLIEKLIKIYTKTDNEYKIIIANQIKTHKKELSELYSKNKKFNEIGAIYNSELVVPCLFNSGAVTGKRGMTCIEIKNGNIYLIYWFDSNKSNRYLNYRDVKSGNLEGTSFYRAVLKKDNLDNVFARIKLLS